MRQSVLAAAVIAAVAAWGAGTAQAGKVEIKGAHVCCPKCVTAITNILKKVDGVSDAVAKPKGDITFTTTGDKATTAALTALLDGGFIGAATDDGKEVKAELTSPKAGAKAEEVTVTDTHVCCGKCQKAIEVVLPAGAKAEFPDKTTVKITGKDLDKAEILESLRKAGFNGKVE